VFVGDEADANLESVPFAENDYSIVTNDELKNLLLTLKDKYGVAMNVNAPNKEYTMYMNTMTMMQ
jgi:hypothetical protein